MSTSPTVVWRRGGNRTREFQRRRGSFRLVISWFNPYTYANAYGDTISDAYSNADTYSGDRANKSSRF